MGQPTRLPDAFNGMWQDSPRDRLPKGKAWNMSDMIPGVLGAPAQVRGGWTSAGSATASTASINGDVVTFAPFSAGSQLLVVTNDSKLVKVVSAVSTTAIGALAGGCVVKPAFLHDNLFLPSNGGATAGSLWAGSGSITSLTAGPPAQYAATYANRLAAANTQVHPQRVFFSNIGDATAWDTTNAWIDVSGPVTGLAALPNVLLAFMPDHCARIRGANPPPQTDMTVDDPVFQYGCTDSRTIAVNGSFAAFANPQGVFLTNGTSTPVDLTMACGIKQFWLDSASAGLSAAGAGMAGGWYGHYYVLTFTNNSTGFIFDTRNSAVVKLGGLEGLCFAEAVIGGVPELYFVSNLHALVGMISAVFSPGLSNTADGNGATIGWRWESPFYESGSMASQRWKELFVEYDIRDGGAAPTVRMDYTTSPESAASYKQITPTLAATTAKTLAKRRVGIASRGIGLRLLPVGASPAIRFYSVGFTVFDREGSRV